MCYCDTNNNLYTTPQHHPVKNHILHPSGSQWVSSWAAKSHINSLHHSSPLLSLSNIGSLYNANLFSQQTQSIEEAHIIFRIIKALACYHLLTVLSCLFSAFGMKHLLRIAGDEGMHKISFVMIQLLTLLSLVMVYGGQTYTFCVAVMFEVGRLLVRTNRSTGFVNHSK